MNRTDLPRRDAAEDCCDAFGRALAARLSDAAHELPHDIGERLRVARSQALERRKKPVHQTAPAVFRSGTAAVSAAGDDEGNFWLRLVAAVPLLALAAGLFALNVTQSDHHVSELAEIDAALLTDDLPPAAYADPGFVQFLKTSSRDPNQ